MEMDFRYEIYNIDNDELLWQRNNLTDITQFNLEVAILTNLSKGDSIKLSNEGDESWEVVIVKKGVEFKTSKKGLAMILRIWVQDDNSSDLTKIPEWWKGIEFTGMALL